MEKLQRYAQGFIGMPCTESTRRMIEAFGREVHYLRRAEVLGEGEGWIAASWVLQIWEAYDHAHQASWYRHPPYKRWEKWW
jgi:hypothetical protein